MAAVVRPGRNTESLCDLNRHPLSLQEAAPTLARTRSRSPFPTQGLPAWVRPRFSLPTWCPLARGVERRWGHSLRADSPFLEDPSIHHTTLKGGKSPQIPFWRFKILPILYPHRHPLTPGTSAYLGHLYTSKSPVAFQDIWNKSRVLGHLAGSVS